MKKTAQLSLFNFFERSYTEFSRRKNGSQRQRTYFAQSNEARREHEILLKKIFRVLKISQFDLEKYVGQSTIGNIEKHSIFVPQERNITFRRFWLIVDIKSAYDTLSFEMFKNFMGNALENGILREIGEKCFTPDEKLITGATCSPFLFNFCMANSLDKKFEEYVSSRKIVFTRYFDDVIFSSHKPFGKRKRRDIFDIVRSFGFKVNTAKVKALDLGRGPIKLNGYFLSYDKKTDCFNLSLDRQYLCKLRAKLEAVKQNEGAYSRAQIDGSMSPLIYLVRNFKKRRHLRTSLLERNVLDLYANYTISAPSPKNHIFF